MRRATTLDSRLASIEANVRAKVVVAVRFRCSNLVWLQHLLMLQRRQHWISARVECLAAVVVAVAAALLRH